MDIGMEFFVIAAEANQTLHDDWPSPRLVHYIYIFRGSCPLREFCHIQNSLYVQVLGSLIFATLLHGIQAVGVSQSLWRGTRNGIIELSQGCHLYSAPTTFGICRHSSLMKDHTNINFMPNGPQQIHSYCMYWYQTEQKQNQTKDTITQNKQKKQIWLLHTPGNRLGLFF